MAVTIIDMKTEGHLCFGGKDFPQGDPEVRSRLETQSMHKGAPAKQTEVRKQGCSKWAVG